MLNGTRSWSVRAAVMGSRELVISPWCRPAGLGSAKATEEERSRRGGWRGGGRQGCVQRALAVPSPPSPLPGVRGEGAGAGCLLSVLAGGPSTWHDDKEGRKTRNGPFVLVTNRYSVPYKMDFPPVLVLCCYNTSGFRGVVADSRWREWRLGPVMCWAEGSAAVISQASGASCLSARVAVPGLTLTFHVSLAWIKDCCPRFNLSSEH